jgi:tripartite-type tricarboxylate transporter receptor subunit TctC
MLRILSGLFMAVLLTAGPLQAQDYPNKPIRMVVGFAPGGGTDLLARLVAEEMTKKLAQTVLVENQVGASGAIAAAAVARAKPDGYTLLNISQSSLTAALMQDQPSFHFEDLAVIGMLMKSPLHFFVSAKFEAKDIKTLIDLIKAKPGTYRYATPGIGGVGHLLAERMSRQFGLNMVVVPYTGDALAGLDVASGLVPIWSSGMPGARSFVESGGVVTLATSGDERAFYAPDVPTFKEAGYDISFYFYNALAAPAGTPKEVVEKLNATLAEIYKDPATLERIRKLGVIPYYASVEESTTFIKDDVQSLTGIIADIKKK